MQHSVRQVNATTRKCNHKEMQPQEMQVQPSRPTHPRTHQAGWGRLHNLAVPLRGCNGVPRWRVMLNTRIIAAGHHRRPHRQAAKGEADEQQQGKHLLVDATCSSAIHINHTVLTRPHELAGSCACRPSSTEPNWRSNAYEASGDPWLVLWLRIIARGRGWLHASDVERSKPHSCI